MAVHMIKLCVGAESVDQLLAWRRAAEASDPEWKVRTRQTPKRAGLRRMRMHKNRPPPAQCTINLPERAEVAEDKDEKDTKDNKDKEKDESGS